MGRFLIVCAASLLSAQVYAAQELPATQPQQSAKANAGQSQTTSASVSATAIPSYPDTPKGLEDLMNEMLKLEKKHDAKALAPYVESLELPNAGTWFRATFGDEIGAQLADSYDRARMNLPLAFPDTLEQLNSKHFTRVVAMRFTDSCNPDASMDEYEVLVNRANQQPLYEVRFTSNSGGVVLPYFAYVNGRFCFLGNFRLNMPATEIVKVDEDTIKRNIVKNVVPTYPRSALMEHISGVVLLHTIIGVTGQVCSLQLISGHPLLAAAAIDGVRQRRYSPYLVKGKSVSVDTTITVTFNIQE